LVFFHRLAPAVVAVDMMNDLKTGGALMGLLASAYFYPYGLMQIPAGLLADSWGPRRSIAAFFLLGAAGSIALGLASTVGQAITARVLVGLGAAMVFVPTLKILTHWFERHRFSRMSGFLMSLGGLGAYTASTPLALLSDALTWRGSMILIGGVTFALSALIWLVVRDTPESAGFPPVGACPAGEEDTRAIGALEGMWMVLKSGHFWPTALCSFFGSMVLLTFTGLWGGPFLMHVYGMSRTQAGTVLSTMAVGIITGAPFMSWLSHRVFRSRKKVLMLSHAAGCCVFAPMAFFTGGFSKAELFVWCFLFNFSLSSLVVVGYAAMKDSFPLRISGTATGVLNIFPFAGAALGQPLAGWFLDAAGPTGGPYGVTAYSSLFQIGLLSLFLAFLASTFVRETYPADTCRMPDQHK
jgi:sugar phosphate permease